MSKIKIKVKSEIAKVGGGFHDFYSHTDIYPKKPEQIFEVENTPFIQRKIETGELIPVKDTKEASKSEEKPRDKTDKSK